MRCQALIAGAGGSGAAPAGSGAGFGAQAASARRAVRTNDLNGGISVSAGTAVHRDRTLNDCNRFRRSVSVRQDQRAAVEPADVDGEKLGLRPVREAGLEVVEAAAEPWREDDFGA